MGKSSKAPSPPPPAQTAAAQAGANKDAIRESAKVNAVAQYGPTGSVTYDRDGNGVPTAQRVNLSDNQQGIFDTQERITQSVSNTAESLAGSLPTAPLDTSSVDGSQVAQALYDRKMDLIRPEMEDARNKADISLVERGIPVGSEIYNDEMGRLDRAESQTLESLSNDAVLAGTSEEQRQLGNMYQARNQQFNEISAALGAGTPFASPQPQALPQYQVAAPDVAGLTANYYNQQNANYQNQRNSVNQGLFGLASLAF